MTNHTDGLDAAGVAVKPDEQTSSKHQDRIERLNDVFYIRWTSGPDYERAFLCVEDGEPDMNSFAATSFGCARIFAAGFEALTALEATRRSALVDAPAGEPAAFVNAHGALTVPDGSPLAAMLKTLPKAPFGEEVLPLFASPTPSVAALQAEIDRLKKERQLLAEAIADAAKRAGIYNGVAPLTGPHLMMLADDLATAALLPPDTEGEAQPVAWPNGARFQGMARSLAQWENMVPDAVIAGSPAQIHYALVDAKHDIGTLAHALTAALASPSPSCPEDGR